jgi:hypothetical protein
MGLSRAAPLLTAWGAGREKPLNVPRYAQTVPTGRRACYQSVTGHYNIVNLARETA